MALTSSVRYAVPEHCCSRLFHLQDTIRSFKLVDPHRRRERVNIYEQCISTVLYL